MEILSNALKAAGLSVSDAAIAAHLKEVGLVEEDLSPEMIALIVEGFIEVQEVKAIAKIEPKSAIEKKKRGKKELKIVQDVPVSIENPFLSNYAELAIKAQESDDRTTDYREVLSSIFAREQEIVARLDSQFQEALSLTDQARTEAAQARADRNRDARRSAIAELLGGLAE